MITLEQIKEDFNYWCPADEEWIHIFDVEHCEYCEKEVLAPNSMKVSASVLHMMSIGLALKDYSSLQELGWSSELGMAVCHDCYMEALEDE